MLKSRDSTRMLPRKEVLLWKLHESWESKVVELGYSYLSIFRLNIASW